MTGKSLLTISLLLPFIAISSVVHADAATATKRHAIFKQTTARAEALPRPGGYYGAGVGAYYGTGAATEACNYQGGPKSGLWTCQRY
jgi:hypothetical protein